MARKLKGIAAAPGIAIAPVVHFHTTLDQIPTWKVAEGSVEAEKGRLVGAIEEVTQSLKGLQKELADIRRMSSEVIEINEQNKQLRKRLNESQLTIDELMAENSRLGSRANREWFVIGALVVIFGIGIGLILPRIRWRKRSSWGEL